MKKAILTFFVALLGVASAASAQTPNFTYPNTVIAQGTAWLNTAITVIMVLMTVWFLIAVFNFIREKDPGKMKDRRKQMINGLIGLFVAVAVWGIISIARNVTGTTNNATPNLTCPPGWRPAVPTSPQAGTCVRG